jgi:ankyrin repeat protein
MATGKRILEMEDKSGHSVLIKCVLKQQNGMINQILQHKHMIKEKDLLHIANYLEGDKTTKLGSTKETRRMENLDQKKQIDVFVNKIWDYLKDKNPKRLVEYVEAKAKNMQEFYPEKDITEIYSEIVNDQKRGNLYTPLHYAIKFQNLKIIKCLVFDYNANITIENKDGHDPVEYLHLGEVSHSKLQLLINLDS